jgi:tetratricopeptide (TPR) repeat protein
METGFRKNKTRIVLHGHIPVLEPIPPKAAAGASMIPDGATAVENAVTANPSDWGAHRNAIDFCRRANVATPDYPLFLQQYQLYRGNEWTFLANAAYKLRVMKEPAVALDFADKALILNPTNAKCLAVRGIIRMADGKREAAARDMAAAYKLDPKSLGDEPETLEAALLFAERMVLTQADKVAARSCLLELGELRAYGTQAAVKMSPKYGRLLSQLDGVAQGAKP